MEHILFSASKYGVGSYYLNMELSIHVKHVG